MKEKIEWWGFNPDSPLDLWIRFIQKGEALDATFSSHEIYEVYAKSF